MSSKTKPTWVDTDLYKALSKRKTTSAAEVNNLLIRPEVMKTITTVLDKGGTTPRDFTFHESGHSFRVAERMWQLIPAKTQKILSDYELGLLLLSAYLHDIGMSPAVEKVERHEDFLRGNKEALSKAEIREFQKWIDDDSRTGKLNIRKIILRDDSLIDYILAYYTRHKHNDWSGDWIREKLSAQPLQHYPGWIDHLVLVCQSHHHGQDHLLTKAFDPKTIGEKAWVHLRYLAMCLRVADVMENDPARTPEVLLNHRQVAPGSVKYWLKDRQFTLRENDHSFTLLADPEKAFIHKAIEETADGIEQELRLCSELVGKAPLNPPASPGLKGYEWEIHPFLKREIHPKNNAYEYIQGAFRPDTSRIMDLLGGHQLYDHPICAYRELIQNAFDAVKEKIAWQILAEKRNDSTLNPFERLQEWGERYTIQLSVEQRDDAYWLVCKDPGVGMTREIIEKYFLHSGVGKRHEIKDLERRCEENGFLLGRTGQFGIGALSYFMLADKVVIRTKRELNTHYEDKDSLGWQFEINGLHDFGELKRIDSEDTGTTLELKLKPEFVKNIRYWSSQFLSFLDTDVSRSPCRISYKSPLGDKSLIHTGWTQDVHRIASTILEDSDEWAARSFSHRFPYVSPDKQAEYHRQEDEHEEVFDEMRQQIRFLSKEGWFNKQLRYRIHIPYFELKKGACMCFLKERIVGDKHYLESINGNHIWSESGSVINISLKGMSIGTSQDDDLSILCHGELDFESIDEKMVNASRSQLEISDEQLIEWRKKFADEYRKLMKENIPLFDNCYAILNFAESEVSFPSSLYWFYRDPETTDDNLLLWKAAEYPGINIFQVNFQRKTQKQGNILQYNGKTIRWSFHDLKIAIGSSFSQVYQKWYMEKFKVNYALGLLPGRSYQPVAVMTEPPTGLGESNLYPIDLPSQWKEVLLVSTYDDGPWVINKHHPLYEYYDASWFENFTERDTEVFTLSSPPASVITGATFLVAAVYGCSEDKWTALREQKGDILKQIMEKLNITEIYCLEQDKLHVYTLDGYRCYSGPEAIEPVLPPIRDEKYYFKVL